MGFVQVGEKWHTRLFGRRLLQCLFDADIVQKWWHWRPRFVGREVGEDWGGLPLMRHIGLTGEIGMPALAEGCAVGVADWVVVGGSWDWYFSLFGRIAYHGY